MALCANAVLLGAILIVLLARSGAPTLVAPAYGQTQAPIAGGAGLFVVPAQFSGNQWGCYVMDVDSQTLCAYQFFPGDKNLHFIAARNFRYDRQMPDFNTQPSPDEIKELVQKRQEGAGAGKAPAAPAPQVIPQ
ncbi:MAG TPA: hypothetical protein VF669_15835 [Tepidisphaeraceae bacterium]